MSISRITARCHFDSFEKTEIEVFYHICCELLLMQKDLIHICLTYNDERTERREGVYFGKQPPTCHGSWVLEYLKSTYFVKVYL